MLLLPSREAYNVYLSLDDPLMWGILPLRHAFSPTSVRWGLGAHDICFRKCVARVSTEKRMMPLPMFLTTWPCSKLASRFFSLGQVLPTHRLMHSPHGGLFQPTVAEAVHALSEGSPCPPSKSSGLIFETAAGETFPSPSAYTSKAWVHVFPEACIHQHPELALRYFKWGVSRLVLEANPAPKLVPMFISGFQDVMHETRKKPRWLPRMGAKIKVVFGDPIDTGQRFEKSREKWRLLVGVAQNCRFPGFDRNDAYSEALRSGYEAVALRISVAATIREEVNRLREAAGHADDDPSLAFAETWKTDPSKRRYMSPVDGSLVHRQ